MLTVQTGEIHARSQPLTHRDCLTGRPGPDGRTWVQICKYHRDGPYVLCGQVIELAENGGEWFKVETQLGPIWAQSRNVRLCSGDGRCTCEAAPRSATC